MKKNTQKKNKSKKIDKITKEMTFQEILSKKPSAVNVLFEKGMFCGCCPAAMNETLEEGAKIHGVNVEEVLKELNK